MKKGRLHIRIDDKLAERAKLYAMRKHTTITAIVEQYLFQILQDEESVEPAEQI